MSQSSAQPSVFFVSGGTLKPNAPSYVERGADREFFERLSAGYFCYASTSRQMGKSSLMARAAVKLREGGVLPAIIDLTSIGEGKKGNHSAGDWYFGIARAINRELRLEASLTSWWQERDGLPEQQRFTEFLEDLVLGTTSQRIVIFVDEIDATLRLPFTDDFFAGIRACYNARGVKPAFERLTFALLGVASPSELIKDASRTPFNIGQRIELEDFTPGEAALLAGGFSLPPEPAACALDRVLYWTGGQPYLTQKLCLELSRRLSRVGQTDQHGAAGGSEGEGLRQPSKALDPSQDDQKGQVTAELQDSWAAQSARADDLLRRVDALVEQLLFSTEGIRDEVHLKYIRDRVLQDRQRRQVLQAYRRVLRGKPVRDNPQSLPQNALKLAGLVRRTPKGLLRLRNPVYGRVFGEAWVRLTLAADPTRRRTLLVGVAGILLVVIPIILWQQRRSDEGRANVLVQALISARPDTVPAALSSLQPVQRLALPQLRIQFDQASANSEDKLNAALGLAAFGDVREGFLLDSAAAGAAGQCMNITRALDTRKALALIEIPQRIVKAETPEARARLAALALFLGDSAPLQRLTLRDPNPTNRTAFVLHYRQWPGDAQRLAEVLQSTKTNPGLADFRSALCAALALVEWNKLAGREQDALRRAMQQLYIDAPDGGTHSAVACALTRWEQPLPEPSAGRDWFINRNGMTMIRIPAGSFLMGDPRGNKERKDETPHAVTLSNAFFISDREVTVALFRQFTNQAACDPNTPPQEQLTNWEGEGPRNSPTTNCPVQQVSWFDAVMFCNWLSRQEGRTTCYRASSATNWEFNSTAEGYRLPTEAQWEYACRAVSKSSFTFGDDGKLLEDFGWYAANSDRRTWPTASKLPNLWGLFDMHGNVWEWCQDWYGEYRSNAESDPTGPRIGASRVVRGGCWLYAAEDCRSAFRVRVDPSSRFYNLGFRVVLVRSSVQDTEGAGLEAGGPGDREANPGAAGQPAETSGRAMGRGKD